MWVGLTDASKRATTPSTIGSEALASLADLPRDEIISAADAHDLASLLDQAGHRLFWFQYFLYHII
jgi:hypothetical protein